MTIEEKRRNFLLSRKPGDMAKLVELLKGQMSRGTVFKYLHTPHKPSKQEQVIEAAWKVLK